MARKFFKQSILVFTFILLLASCTEVQAQKETSCLQGTVACPDGSCVKDPSECKSISFTCPDGTILCPDGSCVKTKEGCSQVTSSCPEGTVFCFDGSCVKDIAECNPVSSSCSKEFPVTCGDGTCVASADQCKDQENTCTKELPFKCKDGMCVALESDCKKKDSCPAELPFKCSDGSCTSSKSECQKPVTKDSSPIKTTITKGDLAQDLPGVIPIDLTIATGDSSTAYSIFIHDNGLFQIQKTVFSNQRKTGDKEKSSLLGFNKKEKKLLKKFENCLRKNTNKKDGLSTDSKEQVLLNTEDIYKSIQYCLLQSKLLADGIRGEISNLCNCSGNENASCLCSADSLCKGGLCGQENRCNFDSISNTYYCPFDVVCARGDCLICPRERPVRCSEGSCVGRIELCESFLADCPHGFEECRSECYNLNCVAENLDNDPENDCECFVFISLDGNCAPGVCEPSPPIDADCTRGQPVRCRYGGPHLICRRKASECPYCPPGFTRCSNNTCVRNTRDCDVPVPCQGLVRCFDNTCRSRSGGCPCVGCLESAEIFDGKDVE